MADETLTPLNLELTANISDVEKKFKQVDKIARDTAKNISSQPFQITSKIGQELTKLKSGLGRLGTLGTTFQDFSKKMDSGKLLTGFGIYDRNVKLLERWNKLEEHRSNIISKINRLESLGAQQIRASMEKSAFQQNADRMRSSFDMRRGLRTQALFTRDDRFPLEPSAPMAMSARPVSMFSQISAKLEQFQNNISHLSTSFHQLGLSISAVASVPMALFAKNAIMMASDFVEWKNVFDQTFKTVLPEASRRLESFRREFDLSGVTAQRVVGDIGELAAGIGFTEKQSLNVSMLVNRIAADVVSFRNITGGIQKASHALFMGAMGNSQSLKSIGVAVRQNSPEFRKMEKDIMAATGATMQQARFMAVLQEVSKQTRYAVGDYNRTWMTFANSLRRVQEYLKDLAIQFGIILIDGLKLNHVLTVLGVVIKSITAVLSVIPFPFKTVIALITLMTIAIGPLLVAIGLLAWSLNGLITAKANLKIVLPIIIEYYRKFTTVLKANTVAMIANNVAASGGISGLLTKIGKMPLGMPKGLTDKFLAFVYRFLFSIPAAIYAIKSAFASLIGVLSTPIIGALVIALGSVYYAFKRITAMDIKNTPIGESLNWFSNMFDSIAEKLSRAFSYMKEEGLLFLASFVQIFKNVQDWYDMFISNVATGWIVLIKSVFTGSFKEVFSQLGMFFKNVYSEFLKFFSMDRVTTEIAQRVSGWKGIDTQALGERSTPNDLSRIMSVSIPKLSKASTYGSKESIEAINKNMIKSDRSIENNTLRTANATESLDKKIDKISKEQSRGTGGSFFGTGASR